MLSPAEVEEVFIDDEEEKKATAIVPDRQLSLAIGKEGQNVRLAARVSGWGIDIKSHSQYFGEGDDYGYDYGDASDKEYDEEEAVESVDEIAEDQVEEAEQEEAESDEE